MPPPTVRLRRTLVQNSGCCQAITAWAKSTLATVGRQLDLAKWYRNGPSIVEANAYVAARYVGRQSVSVRDDRGKTILGKMNIRIPLEIYYRLYIDSGPNTCSRTIRRMGWLHRIPSRSTSRRLAFLFRPLSS